MNVKINYIPIKILQLFFHSFTIESQGSNVRCTIYHRYTVYTPPLHPSGSVQLTRVGAIDVGVGHQVLVELDSILEISMYGLWITISGLAPQFVFIICFNSTGLVNRVFPV